MANNGLTIDISKETKTFKYTLKLINGDNNYVNFLNTTQDLISVSEKGNDVVVSVYDANNITKLRGSIILTNGANVLAADESSVNININGYTCWNLLNPLSYMTAPVRSGNKYTGNWLSESAFSTSNNETFNLGTGCDVINWDFSHIPHGTDTITLNKNENLSLITENTDDVYFEYKKSGSNALVIAAKEVKEFAVDNYKVFYTLQETSKGYNYSFTVSDLLDDLTYDTNTTTYNGTISKSLISLAKRFGYNIDINKYLTDGKNIYLGTTKNKFSFAKFAKTLKNLENTPFVCIKELNNYKSSIVYNQSYVPTNYNYEMVWKEIGRIVLKNYFSLGASLAKTGDDLDVTTLGDISDMVPELVSQLNESYDFSGSSKKTSINDTFLSETMFGGNNNDTFTINGGDDKITGGEGNDTYKINGINGITSLIFNKGDGMDTINAVKGTSLHLYMNDNPNIAYTKQSNNLIISAYGENETDSYYNIKVNNYFKLGDDITIQADKNNEAYDWKSDLIKNFNDIYEANKDKTTKLTITDTFLDEMIYGGQNNDKITSSGGDDNINGGKGNDTINLSNGSKTINYSFADNHGKDTVSIGKNSSANINFIDNPEVIYTKSGNNLVIKKLSNVIDNDNIVTISNYFKNFPELKIGEDSIDFNNGDIITWIDPKAKTINASKYSDEIYAYEKTNKISAGEGDNIIHQSDNGVNISVTAGEGDDTYHIEDLTKTVTINDSGGDDTLIFSSDFNKLLFFDISKTKNGTDLNVIDMGDAESIEEFVNNIKTNKNKLNITPSVKINNYFTTSGDTGKGYIENFDLTEGYDFEGIMSDVAGWLNTYGKQYGFSSVSQFLSKGAGEHTTELATELFGIYNSGYNS